MDTRFDGRHLLEGLDAEQVEAVTTSAQPLRILAGAGSGKTRVLTRRIARRVEAGEADPRRVLAITFTRKAAQELAVRLGRLGLRELPATGTFHAVAYGQLRQHWEAAGRRAPALAERKAPLLRPLLTRNAALGTAELAAEIEWAKARLVPPERYAEEAERADRRPPGSLARIATLYAAYEEEKRKRHVVDFDDLLVRCHAALAENPDLARAQQWRFRHLFVDEFQDVNPLQFGLLRAWLGARTDLCVVGDPNQAIYRWNGADASYLLDFATHFPGAHTVALTTNYRCSAPIVRAAAAVLVASSDRNPARVGSPALPHTVHEGGRPVEVRAESDDAAEAASVARAVRDRRAPGSPWSAQAVLARTNAQATQLDAALRRAGIPTRLRGAATLLAQPAVRQALRSAAATHEALTSWLGDLEQVVRADRGDAPPAEPDDRLEALATLAQLARELASAEPGVGAAALPGWLAANVHGDDAHAGGDAVDVATFHSSKGLEWSIVHLAGVEQGFVPIAQARTAAAVAEEQRLLHVAMTRARDELVVSWARTRAFGDRTVTRAPSPWLRALNPAALTPTTPAVSPLHHVASSRAALEGAERSSATGVPQAHARALHRWRSRVARGAGVPPAVILGDRALTALAEHRPRSREELEASGALGPIAAARYGDAIVAVLADVTGDSDPAT